jgi:hypothetical protein
MRRKPDRLVAFLCYCGCEVYPDFVARDPSCA